MKNLSLLLTLFLGLSGLVACDQNSPHLARLERDARTKLVCQQAFDAFNDRIYDFWVDKMETPSAEEFRLFLKSGLLKDPNFAQLSSHDLSLLLESVTHYYQFLSKTLTRSAPNPKRKLELLTALEIGDSEDEKESLQTSWAREKRRLSQILFKLPIRCKNEGPETFNNPLLLNNQDPPQEASLQSLPPLIEGLRRVFATAYQSCEALALAPIDENTKDVEGIKTLRKRHPDGIGQKRIYGDLEKILETHPYYKSGPSEATCYDARSTPLIYDYGGKPYTTTDPNAVLDFFVNDGSGTEALGLDCSGFIFSAIARGGLKLDPNKEIKSILVNGVSAKMYKDPLRNGLGCFAPLSSQGSAALLAGDIIATKGHVVMVDEIGPDPFGLSRARDLQDCNVETLSSEGFQFIISHSSPWKAGLGISRSKASSYLESSSSFRMGLEKYAVAFCKARFAQKGPDKRGPEPLKIPELSIIRHRGTPECMAPKRIGLKHEACTQQCQWTPPSYQFE